jgi:hypothetical protein
MENWRQTEQQGNVRYLPERGRPERVTESRFHGLYLVACGLASITWGLAEAYWKDQFVLLGFLPSMAVLFAALLWIPAYYARRLGIPHPGLGLATASWKLWNTKLLVVGCLTFAALAALIDLLQHLAHPTISFVKPFVMLVIPWGLLVEPYGDVRSTKEMIIVTLFAVWMATLYVLPVWASLNAQWLTAWIAFDATGLGIGLVLIGLYDHVSLSHGLVEATPANQHG